MDETFKLSKTEHDAVYKDIEDDYFRGTSPVDSPRVIVLGGQPAAGKTALLNLSRQDLGGANVVTINSDDLRHYHPKVQDIIAKGERSFSPLTDPDARKWTQTLLESAIASRRNLVFEGTMRDPGPISATLARMRDAGYTIEARVVAAHERDSFSGIHLRYEKQREDKGYGRWVNIEKHNEAYAGLLKTIDHIEREKLADRVGVYARGARELYSNEFRNDQWQREPGARDAVMGERNREPSNQERADLRETWSQIFELMSQRGASVGELQNALTFAEQSGAVQRSLAQDGQNYVGQILSSDATWTTQLVAGEGRLQLIEHATRSLSGPTQQGQQFEIRYPHGGVGLVKPMDQAELGKSDRALEKGLSGRDIERDKS